MENLDNITSLAGDEVNTVLKYFNSKEFFGSIFIILIAVVVLQIVARLMKYSKKVLNSSGVKDTASSIVYDFIRLGIILTTIILLLQINGVNVSSLVAGLGVTSIVLGLALQDTMKDIIMGIHILLDHFYAVGDSVKIGEHEGKIIDFNIRTTRLKRFVDEAEITICNRDVSLVEKCSNWFDLDIPLSYEADVDTVNAVLQGAAEKIAQQSEIIGCRYLGTQDFCDSSILYRLRVTTSPEMKYNTRRAALQLIQRELYRNGLSVPFNRLDVDVLSKS